ncbi:MAG: 4-(cytidine 5'-diphospho)-2-C-methyl-D-erythritol kinase, partial [Cyclobacteriaceae bacterium]|nr:4-(cytidine 5'-diphospho)-2-C-methyl-D-erythritol kinase [Cyclobacteriaceae bacterium]
MVSFPSCKINLGLHVIAKRADGYHEIDTCFYPVPWTEMLEIIPSKTFSFVCTGLELSGVMEENLCVKAYRLLKKNYPLGEVSIHLHKIIPSGAGLGGGSSDASSTLILLNSIFKLELSCEELKKYASMLGSDCAFFIDHKPMIGSGRGEELEIIDLNLKNRYIAIVKPPVHVSTAEAYAQVIPNPPIASVRE